MRSRLLQEAGATAPVMTMPSGPLHDFDEFASTLFCTEEEDDAAIQAMLAEDPEGEDGTPWEQVKARQDLMIASWMEEALRKIRREGQ